ncbi:MAG TPA: hypothetical protein VMQ73_14155 [Methylomirabilota bacterium]|nr:hypothetical protein [Methylomirabilota bacterium]
MEDSRDQRVNMTRGGMPFLILLVSALLLAVARPAVAADPAVELVIANVGNQPMRCMILFGHWVTQDVGPIAAGGSATVSMWRGQPAGALYIPRFDGRKMMIENVICGDVTAWAESLDQIRLSPLRESAGGRFATSCTGAGRVSCSPPVEAR